MALTSAQKRVLRKSFLFAQADPAAVEGFLEGLRAEPFAAGEEIYTASRFSRAIGVLTRGSATVRSHQGALLNTLAVGDCFGAAALFHPVEAYVTTVRAKLAAEVVFITDRQLVGLFSAIPQTAVNYIAFLSRRIHFLNRKIESFTAPSARDALCLYLLENQRDGAVTVGQGFSQLARQLNIGRASLYRSLDALEAEGVIRRAEKTISIRDPDALRRPI